MSGYSNVFSLSMHDDVSAVSRSMAGSLTTLTARVRTLGSAFSQSNTGNLTIKLKDAKRLFKEAGQNAILFQQALKAAGTSELDASLLTAKMNDQLVKQRRAFLGLDTPVQRAKTHLRDFARVIRDVKTSFNFIAEPVKEFAALINDFAFKPMLDAATFRDDTETALSTALESRDLAKEYYQWVIKASRRSNMDAGEITKYVQVLKSGGFANSDPIRTLIGMIGDVRTRTGAEGGMTLAKVLARIKGRGFMSGRDIHAIQSAGMPNLDLFWQSLAKDANLKEKDPLKRISYLRKLLSDPENLIDGNLGIRAMIHAQQGRRGGSYLNGDDAVERSLSLPGVVRNTKNSWQDLLRLGDLTKNPAVESLKATLFDFNNIFTDLDGAGGRFLKHIETAFSNIFGDIKKITASDIESFIDRVGKGIEYISKLIRRALDWLKELQNAPDKGMFISKDLDALVSNLGQKLGSAFYEGFKSALVQGGMRGLWASLYSIPDDKKPVQLQKPGSLAAAVAANKDVLLAPNSAVGLPKDMPAFIGPPAPSGTQGGGAHSNEIHVPIHVHNVSPEHANKLRKELPNIVAREVTRMLETEH